MLSSESFSTLDYVIFASYCAFIVFMGIYVSREKKGHQKDSKDYFLAGNTLTWWAVGASLIASNISAEQIIGMAGSGYEIGLAIATYELMAAATLILVAKYFLPVFLEKKIYSMPQFLEIRYSETVKTFMAILWLLLYVFVNLTTVMWLGMLSIHTIMGVPLIYAMIGLGLFAIVYSIYGGLKAVAWTDSIQVVFLTLGGIITTYLGVQAVGGGDVFHGVSRMVEEAPSRFDMILEPGQPFYDALPGISVLIGGMWVANLAYWGFNQYITQRALAAKSLSEAQNGMIFAGFIKIFMPLIIVVPGIAAYILMQDGKLGDSMYVTDKEGQVVYYQVDDQGDFLISEEDGKLVEATPETGQPYVKPDKSYPTMLSKYVPQGLKGLTFAALIGAIVSSLASMMNSTSTIFTMDLYRKYLDKTASEEKLVTVGRITSVVAIAVSMTIAPLLENFDQAFQFVQEFSGFFTPGIFVIFMFGVFWPKAKANGALAVAILTVPLSYGLKVGYAELPFIDRMAITFAVLALVMIVLSVVGTQGLKLTFNQRSIGFGAAFVVSLAAYTFLAPGTDAEGPSQLAKLFAHTAVGALILAMLSTLEGLPDAPSAIRAEKKLFETQPIFNFGALAIIGILSVIYGLLW